MGQEKKTWLNHSYSHPLRKAQETYISSCILNMSLENIHKMMIFKCFDINTEKRFDQGRERERETLRWVMVWCEPDERNADPTLCYYQFLAQGSVLFSSLEGNTDWVLGAYLHL